jgi:hypothetical protein
VRELCVDPIGVFGVLCAQRSRIRFGIEGLVLVAAAATGIVWMFVVSWHVVTCRYGCSGREEAGSQRSVPEDLGLELAHGSVLEAMIGCVLDAVLEDVPDVGPEVVPEVAPEAVLELVLDGSREVALEDAREAALEVARGEIVLDAAPGVALEAALEAVLETDSAFRSAHRQLGIPSDPY